jgi:hypothetical protein
MTYDGIEISPQHREWGHVDPDMAQFWTVHLHLTTGGVIDVADFDTFPAACAWAELLLAQHPCLRKYGIPYS